MPLWPYVLLLAAVLLRYVPPPFLIEADFILANQVFRIVLTFPVLFLAVLRLMRGLRLHAIITGLAAVILFLEMLYYLPSTPGKDRNQNDSSAISVLTYNAYATWRPIFQWIKENEPDILVLQEVHYKSFQHDSTELKKMGYRFLNGELLHDSYKQLSIIVRGQITDTGSITLQSPRFQQRIVYYADAVVKGYSVRIVNAHLSSVLYLHDPEQVFKLLPHRYYQARELADSIRSWKHRRVLLLGDFNSTPTDRSLRPLRSILKDSWTEAGYGLGATWHSSQPLHRIDYVMYRGFTGARNPSTVWFGEDIVPHSDHLGYQVTLVP